MPLAPLVFKLSGVRLLFQTVDRSPRLRCPSSLTPPDSVGKREAVRRFLNYR